MEAAHRIPAATDHFLHRGRQESTGSLEARSKRQRRAAQARAERADLLRRQPRRLDAARGGCRGPLHLGVPNREGRQPRARRSVLPAASARRRASERDTPADAYKADPSAMTVDAANRTYVATSLGIQVFDPTGRLCGVITGPPGRLTELAFQENRLYAQSGDKVFVRTTFAEGK